MARLAGYDGKFRLKGRQDAGRGPSPYEQCSDDIEALRAEAARLVEAGDHGVVELAAWNFELNDWVRLETFEAR
jgi:hypothetical protein